MNKMEERDAQVEARIAADKARIDKRIDAHLRRMYYGPMGVPELDVRLDNFLFVPVWMWKDLEGNERERAGIISESTRTYVIEGQIGFARREFEMLQDGTWAGPVEDNELEDLEEDPEEDSEEHEEEDEQ